MNLYSMILDFLVTPAHAGFFDAGLNITIDKARTIFGLSALSFADLAANIGTFLTGLVAALALVALVWGGVMYILSLGDESRSARAKNIILFAIIGLLIAGSAGLIYNAVWCKILKKCEFEADFAALVFGLVNVLLVPAGAIAFGALVYGGYLYMTSGGDESRASRAKNTIVYALLGLAVIGIAGLVVNVVIGLLP